MKREPKLTIYKDKSGAFRWNLKARNGRVIADGSEGYKTLSNAKRAIQRLIIITLSQPVDLVIKD